MRNRYHIIIEAEERHALENVLDHLGVKIEVTIIDNTPTRSTINYIVGLSKYELLYVRLSCKTGWINIDEFKKMKKYYTLVQHFAPQTDRHLGLYLEEQGIEFNLGADFESELKPFGYARHGPPDGKDELLKKYTVLIEDHELSAIMLSVGGVMHVKNRTLVEVKNKLRGCLGWFDK